MPNCLDCREGPDNWDVCAPSRRMDEWGRKHDKFCNKPMPKEN